MHSSSSDYPFHFNYQFPLIFILSIFGIHHYTQAHRLTLSPAIVTTIHQGLVVIVLCYLVLLFWQYRPNITQCPHLHGLVPTANFKRETKLLEGIWYVYFYGYEKDSDDDLNCERTVLNYSNVTCNVHTAKDGRVTMLFTGIEKKNKVLNTRLCEIRYTQHVSVFQFSQHSCSEHPYAVMYASDDMTTLIITKVQSPYLDQKMWLVSRHQPDSLSPEVMQQEKERMCKMLGSKYELIPLFSSS
jgi:hypothetical protein